MESSKKRVQRVNKRGISLDQLFMNAKKAEDEKIVRELEAAKEKLKKTFIKGNFYMITERSSPKDKTVFGASLNNFYIFEFIEKQNIYHTNQSITFSSISFAA